MQLVDQAGGEILADGGCAAADRNIAATCHTVCLFQSGVNAK
jgi:hypothetical protein